MPGKLKLAAEPYRELLIGCGRRRDKLLAPPGGNIAWRGLVTADINDDVKPDLLLDLNRGQWRPQMHSEFTMQFENTFGYLKPNFWDEIHAYEVLEHLGQQGDAESFFTTFSEIWRILKPGGFLLATVPSRYSAWLWGDPSHRRAILPESLVFLDQTQYIRQCDGLNPTPMSDFRYMYKADFHVSASGDNHITHTFCLQAIKPSRIPK